MKGRNYPLKSNDYDIGRQRSVGKPSQHISPPLSFKSLLMDHSSQSSHSHKQLQSRHYPHLSSQTGMKAAATAAATVSNLDMPYQGWTFPAAPSPASVPRKFRVSPLVRSTPNIAGQSPSTLSLQSTRHPDVDDDDCKLRKVSSLSTVTRARGNDNIHQYEESNAHGGAYKLAQSQSCPALDTTRLPPTSTIFERPPSSSFERLMSNCYTDTLTAPYLTSRLFVESDDADTE